MKLVALQRDEILRATFTSGVSIYTMQTCLFLWTKLGLIEETCSEGIHTAGEENQLLHTSYLFEAMQRLSSIAMMSTMGVLDCKITAETVDGDIFYDFVQSYLLPHLMPFNGTNPHSVVVLDNAAIHHVDGIMSMVEQVGALVLFLPPYSPDFNPIEELFSKLKVTIKQYEENFEMEEMDGNGPLVLNVNQQGNDNTIDLLTDHRSLHQWLLWPDYS